MLTEKDKAEIIISLSIEAKIALMLVLVQLETGLVPHKMTKEQLEKMSGLKIGKIQEGFKELRDKRINVTLHDGTYLEQ